MAQIKNNIKKTEIKKNSFASKILHIFYLITDEQYLRDMSGKTYGNLNRRMINFIRVFMISGKKFMKDDCLTKSSAIAYTTLVSLIPTLTVAFTFFSVFSGVGDQKEEIFEKITKYLASHNLQKLNLTPFFEAISGLLDNAASIGGIGAIVMIFSATAVLRNLEQSLNDIWCITKQRPIYLKIIYYWAALTLGPIMMIAGTTLATQLSTAFTSPNYSTIIKQNDKLWIAGNKGLIASSKFTYKLNKINQSNIDFDNQKIYLYNEEQKSFIENKEEIVSPAEFSKADFGDICFIENTGYAVGKNGLVLKTLNSGQNWTIERRGFNNYTKILMLNKTNGIILTDEGQIFTTKDDWQTWDQTLISETPLKINDIANKGNFCVAVGEKGSIIISNDGGLSWQTKQIEESKLTKYYIGLNHINIFDYNNLLITGDEGLILQSSNSGASWKNSKFKTDAYYSSHIFSLKNILIAGDNGAVAITNDGGETWKSHKTGSLAIRKIIIDKNNLWATGEAGLLINSTNSGKTWKGTRGTSIGLYIINFFAPFLFIWLMFLLIYTAMPNMRVPIKPAALGASFTGAVWVIFIFSFIIYVKSFADGTFAVYGALAAIPLFLLMIYTSIVIILYGAEVAYTLMFPETYLNITTGDKTKNVFNIITAFTILQSIYQNFETGNGETNHDSLTKLCNNNIVEVDHFLSVFKDKNLILDKETGGYIPATSSHNVEISKVLDIILEYKYESSEKINEKLKKQLVGKLAEIKKNRDKIAGSMKLADLIY